MSIFRAYDIRGLYPREISPQVARALATAIGSALCGTRAGSIILAYDGRIGSRELAAAARDGLGSHRRITVIDVGLATTPMFYFLAYAMHARGGIMITASHNPKQYNGMKVVGKNAEALGGEEIKAMFLKFQVSPSELTV